MTPEKFAETEGVKMDENNIAFYPADISDYAVLPYKAYGAICPCCGSFFESRRRPIQESNYGGVLVQTCPDCAQVIGQSEYKGKHYSEILNEMEQECAKRGICFVGGPESVGGMVRQLKKWKEDKNGRIN